MATKQISLLTAFVMLLLASCSKDIATDDHDTNSPNQISVRIGFKGISGYAGTLEENEIRNIDVLSFVKIGESTDYVFEEQTSIASLDAPYFTFTRTGSLPRKFYFITNGSSAKSSPTSALDELKPTSDQFEAMSIARTNAALAIPLTMVSKVELPTPQPTTDMAVALSHIAACLTIDNKYAGFTIDSLVVRDAISGAYLFNSTTPTAIEMPRININYGTANTLYLYQTDASTLSVYGKYKGTRAVFDIALNNIKSGTRYKVLFRSINDSAVNFATNLKWEIAQWTPGTTVETTPDWK